jgi:hypothetical protein
VKLSMYGEPGVGKTTILLALFDILNKDGFRAKSFDYGLLRGDVWGKEGKTIWIPGVFDGSMYQGTDRLSMAVQPHAVKFLKTCASSSEHNSYLFEGDRLFNQSFLDVYKPSKVILIIAPEGVAEERRKGQGRTQSETILKSRRTRINNISKVYPVEFRMNETQDDIQSIAQELKTLLCS